MQNIHHSSCLQTEGLEMASVVFSRQEEKEILSLDKAHCGEVFEIGSARLASIAPSSNMNREGRLCLHELWKPKGQSCLWTRHLLPVHKTLQHPEQELLTNLPTQCPWKGQFWNNFPQFSACDNHCAPAPCAAYISTECMYVCTVCWSLILLMQLCHI